MLLCIYSENSIGTYPGFEGKIREPLIRKQKGEIITRGEEG